MDLNNIVDKLEEVELTKSEIKVYLALLEIGPSTSGPIITQSNTSNSKIYVVLNKLIEKGLVTYYIQNKIKYYKAVNPTQLLRYLKEKENKIKEQEKSITELIPELYNISREKEENEALVFRGPKAIKSAFNDIVDTLEKGQEVHIMGTYNFGENFLRLGIYFQQIRSKKGIKAKFLINNEAKNVAKIYSKYAPIEIRYMKKGVNTPAVFLIYKNKVIINLGDEMVMFMIKSDRTAKAFEVYFDQLWKVSQK